MGWKWWKKATGVSEAQRQASRKSGVRLSRTGCGFIPAAVGIGAFLSCVIACGGGGSGGTGQPAATEATHKTPTAADREREQWAAYVRQQRAARTAKLERDLVTAEANLADAKKRLAAADREFKKTDALRAEVNTAKQKADDLEDELAAADQWEPDPPPHISGARAFRSSGPVSVSGYKRRDGTYVKPHTRSR